MVSPYWVHELALWVQARRHRRRMGGAAAPPRRADSRRSSQDRVPEFLKVPVVMSIHKGIRYHKKNVAKMAEKEGSNKKGN